MHSIQAGAVCWERLQLVRPLPNGSQEQLWLATDLRTASACTVEFLPTHATGSVDIVHPPHPGLLSFYRLEISDSVVAAVSAFHPLLDCPALGNQRTDPVAPKIAFDGLCLIGDAVSSLHETGHRAHGAIVPSRIRSKSGTILLTGYPYACETNLDTESAFVSPQSRESKGAPRIVDDVYSLAAIAFFLFSGGVSPPMHGTSPAITGHDIERIRRDRGLPPTGWLPGWDRPLINGLASLPSLRPSSIRSLMEELSVAVGRPVRNVSSAVGATAPLRVPVWRSQARLALRSKASTSSPHPGSPAPTFAELREERSRLQHRRVELDQRQQLLTADIIQIEAARAQADGELAGINLERIALSKATTDFKLAAEKLDRDRKTFDEERGEFERTKSDRLAKREQQLEALVVQQESNRAQIETRARALETQEATLRENSNAMDKREILLANSARELEAREAVCRELQRQCTDLCGSSDPEDWKVFITRFGTSRGTARPLTSEELSRSDESAPRDAAPSPQPTPPKQSFRVTLAFADGRQLHIFTDRVIRFGRHAKSDFVLDAAIRGQRQPNLNILREISRKHFELQVTDTSARIADGWSEDKIPSQHGLCIDGRRVSASGATLHHDALLSVTTRAPSNSVPHWRVALLAKQIDHYPVLKNRGVFKSSLPKSPPLSAVCLRRLDDSPGDMCVLLDNVTLADIGYTDPSYCHAALNASAEGIVWILGTQRILLTEGSRPHPDVSSTSGGWS